MIRKQLKLAHLAVPNEVATGNSGPATRMTLVSWAILVFDVEALRYDECIFMQLCA